MAWLHLDSPDIKPAAEYFELGNKTVIGRGAQATLTLSDPLVSRMHLSIELRQSRYFVCDLGSANGSYLQGVALEPYQPLVLKDQDVVTLGNTTLVFLVQRGDKSVTRVQFAESDPSKLAITSVLSAQTDVFEPEESTENFEQKSWRLKALLSFSETLSKCTTAEQITDALIQIIFQQLHAATHCTLVGFSSEDAQMQIIKGFSRKKDSRKTIVVSRSVIEHVRSTGEAIICDDAASDARFKASESIVQLAMRSILAAPLRWKDDIIGVLFVESSRLKGAFQHRDLLLAAGLSFQSAIALKNTEHLKLAEKEARHRGHLSRYLSPDVVDGVIKGTIPLSLGGTKMKGTVLFCDIVGFTRLSEKLAAEELFGYLRDFFQIANDLVLSHRGTVHKFGGDMLMALWDVLRQSSKGPLLATRAAVALQQAVCRFNMTLEASSALPIYCGVGINTGTLAGGNIGSDEFMEYTVLGEQVNIAQRIESLSSRWQVFVSQQTYREIQSEVFAIALKPVVVKGRSEPLSIYSIRGLRVDASSLETIIPVYLYIPDGGLIGSGMVTKVHISQQGRISIELITSVRVLNWSTLRLQLDCPELSSSVFINGAVQKIDRLRGAKNAQYTFVQLTQVDCSEDGLQFWKPGKVFVSQAVWTTHSRQ